MQPNLCTHLIYAFATLDPGDYTITPNDEEYDIVQGESNTFCLDLASYICVHLSTERSL